MGPALVALLVIGYWLAGERLRERIGVGSGAAPPTLKGDRVRVVTWNLHNFPGDDQNLPRLRERLAKLDADLLAVQEIHDPAALANLLPGWQLHLSEHGGRGHQRLGIALDPTTLELVGPVREHPELTMNGHVRPAVSARLRVRGGPDFHVVVVHLKAKSDGLPLRRKQWPLLAELARDLLQTDPDLVLLGDFNATGPAGGSPDDELTALADILGPLGLHRIPPAVPCSAYWDGARRDAWQEPSLLDLVWVAGLAPNLGHDPQSRPLHHCARHHCQAFRSTPAYPEPDFADLSDHCPVALDLE
jgi:endonuclease/exonuclease/phosphatase family metal-dependent hydrolase